MKTNNRWLRACVWSGLLLAASACGGDDDDSDATEAGGAGGSGMSGSSGQAGASAGKAGAAGQSGGGQSGGGQAGGGQAGGGQAGGGQAGQAGSGGGQAGGGAGGSAGTGAAGSSGDCAATPVSPAPATAQEFLAQYTGTYCASTIEPTCTTYDAATCAARSAPLLTAQYDPSQATGYVAAQGAQCLGALAQGNLSEACAEVCGQVLATMRPAGTAAEGQPCKKGRDCAPSSEGQVSCSTSSQQDGKGTVTTRVCVVDREVKVGDACEFSLDCEDDQFCTPAKVCALRLAVGAACEQDQACQSSRCEQGACAEPSPVGGDCFQDAECAAGAYCDAGGTCAAKLPNGSPCPDGTGSSACLGTCSYGVCQDANAYYCAAPPAALADAYEQLLAAGCDAYKPCCQQAGLTMTPGLCPALFGILQPPPPATGVQLDQASLDACLASVGQASCSGGLDFSFGEGVADTPDPCDFVFTSGKKVAPGGACLGDQDCAMPSVGEVRCDGGVCVNRRPGKAGDACGQASAGVRYVCRAKDGLQCQSGACAPLPGAGQPCTDFTGCQAGLACVDDVCAAPVAAGQPCKTNAQCKDSYCDGSTCQAKKADKAACTYGEECQSGGCINGACEADIGFAVLFCQ